MPPSTRRTKGLFPPGSTYRPKVQGSSAYSFSLDEATIVSFDAAQPWLLAETPGQATLMVMTTSSTSHGHRRDGGRADVRRP